MKKSSRAKKQEKDEEVEPCADAVQWPASGEPLATSFGSLPYFEAIEDNIPRHPSILAAGKRRTGKSTSLDNLMSQTMLGLPFGIVMSETLMNGFWQKRVPPRFCFQGWREDILLALVARQKKMVAKYGKEDPKTYAFIILDDVIADQKAIRWSKTINSFFTEGRHLNITVLITTQYMRGIGPMLRGNMDICIMQPIYSVLDREVIRDLYAGWMSKKEFFQLMDEVVTTEESPESTARDPRIKVRVMVVQDWRQTSDCEKKFCWWDPVHSDELPAYRLCDPKYWEPDVLAEAGKELGGGNGAPMLKRKDLVDTLDEVNSVLGDKSAV